MTERMKTMLSFTMRFVFSAAILLYLFKKIDVEHTLETFRSANWEFIAYAVAVFLLIHVVILVRWFILTRALELNVPFGVVARYFFIGLFGNLFLPTAIGGDVIKVIGLCRYSPQKAKVIASVILDRLAGFFGVVAVAIIAFSGGFRLIDDRSLVWAIVSVAVISGSIAAVLFSETLYEFCCRIFSPFPKIKQKLMSIHYDVVLLKGHWSAMFLTVGMSCFTQFLLSLDFYLVGRALNQDINLLYFLIFVPLICVVSSLPSIGGLGFREAGAAYLFAKVGVAPGIAVSISLINFIFMMGVGIVGGMLCLVTKSPRPAEIQQVSAEMV